MRIPLNYARAIFSIYDHLPLSVRPTYYYNLRSALINGVALGIGGMFENVAAKILGASTWQLALMHSLSGAGMILAFFWGSFAARRRKMPFVFWPWVTSACFYFALGWISKPLGFCLLAGANGLVGQVGAPAAAGILSSNYPSRLRGMITGFTRRWHMLVAAVTGFVGAEIITRWPDTYHGILPLGGVFSLVAALIYLRVRVRGEKDLDDPVADAEPFRPLEPFKVLVRDARFRSYMIDFFIFGLSNLMLSPITPIVLREDLHANFNHMQWTTMIIPQTIGILTVGLWGRVLDRSNPIIMRGYMNLIWAILPLTYFLAPRHDMILGPLVIPPVAFVWVGSFFQGLVAAGQGLIWTLGAMYFAKKEDVPLYQGVHIGLTGIRSLCGAFLGPLMVSLLGGGAEARRMLFPIATAGMVFSGILMLRLARRMRREMGGRLPRFSEMETGGAGAEEEADDAPEPPRPR